MSNRKAWFSRQAPPTVTENDISEVIDYLTPDLQATLAGLHNAPPAVATAVVQLLSFGSRAALGELGLVVTCGSASDATRRSVALTPLGYQVMAELAARIVADPGGVEEWTRQAQLAATRRGVCH
jgi:hypothetical protein